MYEIYHFMFGKPAFSYCSLSLQSCRLLMNLRARHYLQLLSNYTKSFDQLFI